MQRICGLLILYLTLCFLKLQAQYDSVQVKQNNFRYGVELGSYFSLNNKIPFWQKSNQFGAVPQTGNSIYFRQMIESRRLNSSKKFTTDYCFDLVTIVGEKPLIILPEAFINLASKEFL